MLNENRLRWGKGNTLSGVKNFIKALNILSKCLSLRQIVSFDCSFSSLPFLGVGELGNEVDKLISDASSRTGLSRQSNASFLRNDTSAEPSSSAEMHCFNSLAWVSRSLPFNGLPLSMTIVSFSTISGVSNSRLTCYAFQPPTGLMLALPQDVNQ